jgi:hypothetical protein
LKYRGFCSFAFSEFFDVRHLLSSFEHVQNRLVRPIRQSFSNMFKSQDRRSRAVSLQAASALRTACNCCLFWLEEPEKPMLAKRTAAEGLGVGAVTL